MPNQIRFDPEIHVELETQTGFVPKTAEQDPEAARIMAHVSRDHEDLRLDKGLNVYNAKPKRQRKIGKAGTIIYASQKVKNRHRVAAEKAADKMKEILSADDMTVIKMSRSAEKDWFIDFDGVIIDATNLVENLSEITSDQRHQLIESLQLSMAIRRKEIKFRLATDFVDKKPELIEQILNNRSRQPSELSLAERGISAHTLFPQSGTPVTQNK